MKNWKFISTFIFLGSVVLFSQAFSQQDIFKIKLQINSKKQQEFIKRIGLDCPKIGECECEANIEQTNQLRKTHYDFSMPRERKGTQKETALHKPVFSDTSYRPIKLKPKKKGEPPDKELLKRRTNGVCMCW